MVQTARYFEFFRWSILFWTDSATMFKYTRNDKSRFDTFIANRLIVMHDGAQVEQ